ncbi:hypothetical protein GCM10028895_21360 [Pontibacter rugosus]
MVFWAVVAVADCSVVAVAEAALPVVLLDEQPALSTRQADSNVAEPTAFEVKLFIDKVV